VNLANNRAKVSLRNISTKAIDGIQLSVDGSIFQIEFLDAEEPGQQKIQRGEAYEEWFPINNNGQPIEVAVLAVTFDDKTSDGDSSLANEIFQTRRGVKKELSDFRPFLLQALSSSSTDSFEIVAKLKKHADDLLTEENTDPGPMRMGRHKAKQQILSDIGALNKPQLNGSAVLIHTALTNIKNRHDRRIQGLE
jgi:hypothetical protein